MFPGFRVWSRQGCAAPKVYRARLLTCLQDEATLQYLEDGIVAVDSQGVITEVCAYDGRAVDEDFRPAILMPSFVDAHIHYPQLRIHGAATGPLLEWLATSTFPEEARYEDEEHARRHARCFLAAMVSAGTTQAMVYGSCHASATDILMQEAQSLGIRLIAGPVLMDTNCPENLIVPPEEALGGLQDLVEKWHGQMDGRLQVAVVPRFALTCTEKMMKAAGEMARKHDLWVTTHLSENVQECEVALSMFPDCSDYLEIYEKMGLVSRKSAYAHCIYLSEDEMQRLARQGAVVVHCPDSNVFLGSGKMVLQKLRKHQATLAFGSDVAGGRSYRMNHIASVAYDVSLQVQLEAKLSGATEEELESTSYVPMHGDLLWSITRGGAQALLNDQIGVLAPGFEADMVVMEVPEWADSLKDALGYLFFDHDAPRPLHVFVKGQQVWDRREWAAKTGGGYPWAPEAAASSS